MLQNAIFILVAELNEEGMTLILFKSNSLERLLLGRRVSLTYSKNFDDHAFLEGTQSARNIWFHLHLLKRAKDIFISLLKNPLWKTAKDIFILIVKNSKSILENFLKGCSWDAEWAQVSSFVVAPLSAGKTTARGGAWYRSIRRWRTFTKDVQLVAKIGQITQIGVKLNYLGPTKSRCPSRWITLREEDVQLVPASHTGNCLHCKKSNRGKGEGSQLRSEIQCKFSNLALSLLDTT